MKHAIMRPAIGPWLITPEGDAEFLDNHHSIYSNAVWSSAREVV